MRSFAASALALALVAFGAPAGAHTTLDFASPGPGTRVSGDVDRILLGFADPVSDPVVTLAAPDGSPIGGTVEFIDERTIAYRIDPLEVAGEYVVRYRVTAPDDDDQPNLEGGFAFTYLGGASRRGSNWPYLAGIVLVLGAIGAVLARRAMREAPPESPTDTD